MGKIILSNGIEMPPIGMGTWPLYGQELIDAVSGAYKLGYRLFDTSDNYYNEVDLGYSLNKIYKEQGATRGDVFLVTKLSDELYEQGDVCYGNNKGVFFWKTSPVMQKPNSVHNVVNEKLEKSLKALQTDYIDLLLMHWPYPDYFIEIWEEMEHLYKSGKCRAIGLCNSRERHFEILRKNCSIYPMVNQIEISPINTKTSLIEYSRKNGIQIMIYSPLKSLNMSQIRDNSFVKELSSKYKKSMAQIILRWNVQNGYCPIPKSSHEDRLRKNIEIFDFTLAESEMAALNALNEDYQYMAESTRCPGL